MLRKFNLSAMIILAFLCFGISSAKAVNWPGPTYNEKNNNRISDPLALSSTISEPRFVNVHFNLNSQLVVEGVLIYCDGFASSSVYAYDVNTMALLWSKNYPKQVTSMVYDNGQVFYGAGSLLYSVAPRTGTINWSTQINGNNIRTYHASKGRIYANNWYSNINKLAVIDENGGNLLFLGGGLVDSMVDIALSPSNIFVTAGRWYGDGGTVYSYDRDNFQLVATSQKCRSSSVSTVYDEEENKIYLSASNAALRTYDGDTLESFHQDLMWNLSRLVKYNNSYYSTYNRRIYSFSALDRVPDVNRSEDILPSGVSFSTDPIIVNGVLYAGASDGTLLIRNLETRTNNIVVIDQAIRLSKIIYGSERFVITSSYNGVGKISVYNYANLGWPARSAGLSVMSPYNTTGMNQYLGQTHAHVEPERQVVDSGLFRNPPTAADVVERYRSAGYDFVALTEHNKILSDPFVQGVLHIPSEEDTQGSGGNHILALNISSPIDESMTDQQRIDAVVDQGGIPILAHPNSKEYLISSRSLMSLKQYKHLEILNNVMKSWSILSAFVGKALSVDKWDTLLNFQIPMFATAGDDYTPYDGGFNGAAISVFSPSASKEDILENIGEGNFYALEGSRAPRITDVYSDGVSYHISANEPSHITFIGKGGKSLKTERNVTYATYTFQGDEGYVRAEVVSAATAKKAWAQAVLLAQPMKIENIDTGQHDIFLPQALLSLNASELSSAEVLSREQYPEESPPSGYYSPVYNFVTSGEVLEGTKLAIDYSSKKLVSSSANIAIYTYDEVAGKWIDVATSLDTDRMIAMAGLSHFSLYTLSAKPVSDNINPELSLISPSVLDNLTGVTEFIAEASDNEAVIGVSFLIDGTIINSDLDGTDGWSAISDMSESTRGNHTLTLVAEDFAGNISEKEYPMSVDSAISGPEISIEYPAETNRVHGDGVVAGSFSSYYPVDEISIYLDDTYIGDAEFSAAAYSMPLDWSNITDGNYKLTATLSDVEGNSAIAEQDIRVGKKTEAAIKSPQNISYLRGGELWIDVEITPPEADVEIYIDGEEVENHVYPDLLSYSLGSHLIEVKAEGELIASRNFSVITSYADTKDIVWRLYAEGHITNFGLATAISARLSNVERQGLPGINNKSIHLDQLLEYINQQKDIRFLKKINGYGVEILAENIYFLNSRG